MLEGVREGAGPSSEGFDGSKGITEVAGKADTDSDGGLIMGMVEDLGDGGSGDT